MVGTTTENFLWYVDSERAIASFPGSQTGTEYVKKAWKMVLLKELAVFAATAYIKRFGK